MDPERFSPGDLVEARGREWVVLPAPSGDVLRMRPLSGSEEDALTISPALEISPVRPARFSPPTAERLDTQDGARLLADALRLSLRRGAGPFRSAARLGVEPRAYQLVPLMMALKLQVVRLLIADDVGIGKTIEAGLILREMLDRGQIDRFSVLCPPHLVDQWIIELSTKFDIDAAPVTAGRARGLERGLPTSQSLFDAYPFTVVSLDYIKADSRREEFARACPPLVIVDEAHACVGSERGRHQRYELLRTLTADAQRHLLLLTATPHSGDDTAFNKLLGLVGEEFVAGERGDANAVERYRRRLARHVVQRRRQDIIEGGWQETRIFPRHEAIDLPYTLTPPYAAFQDAVLDYCLAVTNRAGDDSRRRRLAFWGTLALMRCVGSSPAAAAKALFNRLGSVADEESVGPAVFDDDRQGLLDDGDLEPGTALDHAEERGELERLIAQAAKLDANRSADPKFARLIRVLKAMTGARPVIFCRFIATAEAVGEQLRKAFPRHHVAVVTGALPPDDRRVAVQALEDLEPRMLVATDCLSEGINLQTLFDAVIHYDLSWNPTRHQQREGRVDRYGQKSSLVRTATLFGDNSAIDGAVLGVILDKARRIQERTGVAVPAPENSDSVANALMQALTLRSGTHRAQLAFDFGEVDAGLETAWRDIEENARASRTRFAQGTLRPDEVLPEWQAMRALNGGRTEVERFMRRSLARIGAPLEPIGEDFLVHIGAFPEALAERLAQRGLKGTRRIRFADRPAPDVSHVGRVHPLVAALAEGTAEGALDPQSAEFAALGRAGSWRTRAVQRMTTVLLLRLRFKMISSGRSSSLMLAEEATGLAFAGTSGKAGARGWDALALLEVPASGNLEREAIIRQVERAGERLAGYDEAIAAFAAERGAALSADHERLTEAAGGGAAVTVTPVLPADVIGLYVLLPEGE